MSIDVAAQFTDVGDLPARTLNTLAKGLTGSVILDIAAEVNAIKASGTTVANFTIGDFAPEQFRIPPALTSAIEEELRAGNTNYPPAVGVPELRKAIRNLYKRELGLDYPEGCVQVGSGARPPIFSAYASILEPGDQVVYPVPSWNVRYYAYLSNAEGIPLATKAENGFMPSLEEVEPYLKTARVLAINSPLNPSGTMITRELLASLCEAILTENHRREAAGERPLMLVYDQVYWQLTFSENLPHITPLHINPEMARYTIFIDAISKCWAATGLRVGWAVVPPWLLGKMKPLVGHMGAWAARPEQLATAKLMDNPELLAEWMPQFKADIQARLDALHNGLQALKAEGFPVDSMSPEGAIYLTARADLIGTEVDGETLDEDGVRKLLLHKAGIAVVPFSAFGYPAGSGWLRFSVGAVSVQDIHDSLGRLRELLVSLR